MRSFNSAGRSWKTCAAAAVSVGRGGLMIEPHSVEATLRDASDPYGQVVDVQRARADKAEAKLSAIHALVTTPGIPALREHILNVAAPRGAEMTRQTTRSTITDPEPTVSSV